jgi:putative membrane protein
MNRRLTGLLLVPWLALGACRARVAETPTPALTDAQIAAVVVQANNADIMYAELALAKSQTSAVREFATMTKRDHESVNEAAVALVTRLGVTPAENALSFDLRDDAETKRLTLRDFEGFAFDSAYAANEVTYHTTLLGTIDSALIPSASNTELRNLLIAVRPAVAAHLTHAQRLSASLRRR